MPTVYLKGGKTLRVRLEDLEDFLYANRSRIETRRKKLRRPPVDISTACTSSKCASISRVVAFCDRIPKHGIIRI